MPSSVSARKSMREDKRNNHTCLLLFKLFKRQFLKYRKGGNAHPLSEREGKADGEPRAGEHHVAQHMGCPRGLRRLCQVLWKMLYRSFLGIVIIYYPPEPKVMPQIFENQPMIQHRPHTQMRRGKWKEFSVKAQTKYTHMSKYKAWFGRQASGGRFKSSRGMCCKLGN